MTTENLAALLMLWVIKPLLVLMIVLAGAALLRKTSAALQHFWLASGVVAVLLLPILAPLIPVIEWQVLPAADESGQHKLFAWWQSVVVFLSDPGTLLIFYAGYIFVASSLLFYFLLGLGQLLRQSRAAKACDDTELHNLLQELCAELDVNRRVRLLMSKSISSPQMWGLLRPIITLPFNAARWTNERKFSVLIHELGHVARHDWLTTVLVKILCGLFWFLPPVWWLAARLDHCAEMACDDFIYRLRDKHIAYAENLLAFAVSDTVPVTTPALPMAGHAPIFYRIQAILDQRRPHTPVAPEARQYWVLTLLMLLVPLAGLQLIPIHETLLAKLFIIQDSGSEKDAVLLKDNGKQNPIVITDSQSLLQLKRQLLSNELPQKRTGAIENVVVTAERPEFIEDPGFATETLAINVPQPLIRVEGYMPLQTVIPVYPRTALNQGIEGEVTVSFTVAADGTVIDVKILDAQPRRVFDRAVLNAVQDWRYSPQIIDGRPVIIQGAIEKFTFQIEPASVANRRR